MSTTAAPTLEPHYSVTRIDDSGEIHFSMSGFWSMETMAEFQRELLAAGKPFFENGIKMRSLADLRGFVAQNKDVSNAIRTVVVEAIKLGTIRSAVVYDSMLVKMQYARLNEGLDLETFESKDEAIKWLRRPA